MSATRRRAALAALCVFWAAAVAPMAARAAKPPALTARNAALIEVSTGTPLLGLHATARVPIASATKLMTALVTLEHAPDLARQYADPRFYFSPADSQIGLVPGERMSVHDLVLAMLLPSADDAAADLAYNIGHRSVGRFIAMMNARAHELHLSRTHYATPVGLDTPGNYSSAFDLVKLARYVRGKEGFFRLAVGLRSAVLHTGSHVRVVTNRNDLVGRYHWINGVKTGHTLDAGYVLVGSGTRGGMTLISAVLGTSSESARDADTIRLLSWGFQNYRLLTPVRAGTVLARARVRGRPNLHPAVIAGRTYTGVFPRASRVRLRLELPRQLSGPMQRHAIVGRVLVRSGGRTVASIPLLLAHALPAPTPASSTDAITEPFALVLLVVLLSAAVWLVMFRRRRQGNGGRAGPEGA